MEKENMKVMTVRLSKTVVDDLAERMRDLGMKRDDYLRTRLPYEVNLLAEIPTNSEVSADYLQKRQQRQRLPLTKIGLKLPEILVKQINQVCTEKNVPRDIFVETFFRYLAYGWPEMGAQSPLVMAAEYLIEPYRDVEGGQSIYKKRCTLPESALTILKELDTLISDADGDVVAADVK